MEIYLGVVPETWAARLTHALEPLHLKLRQIISLTNTQMSDFNFYLFFKYMITLLVVHWISCVGLGWLTLVVMYCMVCEGRRRRVAARLELAYADADTLKSLWTRAERLMPDWVSYMAKLLYGGKNAIIIYRWFHLRTLTTNCTK